MKKDNSITYKSARFEILGRIVDKLLELCFDDLSLVEEKVDSILFVD